MVFTNITMNLSALSNINPPNINLTNSNVFSSIISTVNVATNDYIIFAIMFIILIITYLTLTDKTQFTDFGYDDIRGLNLSLSISALIGLKLISVGWSGNFISVGMFIILWLLTLIGILIYNNYE